MFYRICTGIKRNKSNKSRFDSVLLSSRLIDQIGKAKRTNLSMGVFIIDLKVISITSFIYKIKQHSGIGKLEISDMFIYCN